MLISITYRSKWTTAAAFVLFGLALPSFSQSSPKVVPTYRPPSDQAPVSQRLTSKEAKKLAATAESREDHLKLAAYYKTEADRLDAQAAGYEEAAVALRRGPSIKNLIAPTTAGRYEFQAKGFRKEAGSNRALAARHEQMANRTAVN